MSAGQRVFSLVLCKSTEKHFMIISLTFVFYVLVDPCDAAVNPEWASVHWRRCEFVVNLKGQRSPILLQYLLEQFAPDRHLIHIFIPRHFQHASLCMKLLTFVSPCSAQSPSRSPQASECSSRRSSISSTSSLGPEAKPEGERVRHREVSGREHHLVH